VSVDRIVELGQALRRAGLPVGTGRLRTFAEATTLSPRQLYWAGRVTLVGRRDDLAVYDRVFRELFGFEIYDFPGKPPPEMQLTGTVTEQDVVLTEADDEIDVPEDVKMASRIERLRQRSFAKLDAGELAELSRSINRLRLVAPVRRTRRRIGSRRGDLDLRRTVRRALRTGGDPVTLYRRTRRERPRRVVLLLDISGSMSSFSRALLIFAHAALLADQRWEAFTFGTRLTRLTGVLRQAKPDEALARAAREARDWDGGTRIGDAVREMLARYGKGDAIRGAVVVICSDGLDVGEPELLASQMARLHRLAHKIVWLNPLQENPEYQPLARGMAAALPHIDLFASGHNLAEIEKTCEAIGRL
jgi:uncharacterized protein with von Willebrand factor type A (vWA) domain